MRLPHKGRVLTITSIAAAGVLVAGGIAVATIPDGDGVIHGCYAKKGGSVKVINTDKGQTCPVGYLPLNWAQEGVPGEDGDDGADGDSAYQVWLDAGNTGTEDDFLASLKGDKGDNGEDGLSGVVDSYILDVDVPAMAAEGDTANYGTYLNCSLGDTIMSASAYGTRTEAGQVQAEAFMESALPPFRLTDRALLQWSNTTGYDLGSGGFGQIVCLDTTP